LVLPTRPKVPSVSVRSSPLKTWMRRTPSGLMNSGERESVWVKPRPVRSRTMMVPSSKMKVRA
jgi:hypothetical protein